MKEIIKIFDTTLRDGEQSPGASMNITEKIRVAKQLEKLNVDIIEAGFPIASKGDFEAVHAIAEIIEKSSVAGLARLEKDDIDAAWNAVKDAKHPRLHVFIATSDLHLAKKLKKSHKEVLEDVKRYVSYARNLCEDVEFSAEDATRSNLDYLCQVVKIAIKEGASTINIPDTVGYTVPKEFFQIISTLKQRVEGIDSIVLSVHCHNDLGLAVANSLSAIEAGARQVECTINGIGERAGNASLEEIVMAIRTRKDYFSFTTNINTEQIYPTSRLVSMITGIPVQPNKAIVGDNAFAHEAGIHQDGILKEKQTYEIMTPESIGIKKSKLVLGKHSGRHALKEKLKDMGYDLSQKELDIAFASFKKLADKKKDVYDEDLESILLNEVYKIPDKYKLLNVNVACGTITIPTATVQMEVDGKILKEAGFGDGPVDATYKTIKKITNSKDNLVRFSVAAITKGTEAQGEVSIRIQEGKFTATGQGTDTDVIVASAKAYVDALNKLHYRKNKKEMLKSNI